MRRNGMIKVREGSVVLKRRGEFTRIMSTTRCDKFGVNFLPPIGIRVGKHLTFSLK